MGLVDETGNVSAFGYVPLDGYGAATERSDLLRQLRGRGLSLEPIDGYIRPLARQRQDGCSTDALLCTCDQRTFSLKPH
jgi:hypothetical protein